MNTYVLRKEAIILRVGGAKEGLEEGYVRRARERKVKGETILL